MRSTPARALAAAATVGAGAVAGVIAYLKVGGLPGILYAAGICLAACFGAVALGAYRATEGPLVLAPEAATPPRRTRWRRKSRIIAEFEHDLAARDAELDEHRHALAALATQLSREAEAAQQNAQHLGERIGELEAERDGLAGIVASERDRFEQTLEELGGGIGRHDNELAELERELEALITR